MTIQDRNYLKLQFQCKIYQIYGLEFQFFFDEVMKQLHTNFIKIDPSAGDGGNDGFFRNEGIYYQIYSPKDPLKNPNETYAEAAEKASKDFYTVLTKWNSTYKINEYNFVFNDKYHGSTQIIEETIARLKKENPNIEFKLILMHDFELSFLKLPTEAQHSLGFDITNTQIISFINTQFEFLQTELDKQNLELVTKNLSLLNEIIITLDDESISFTYDYLNVQTKICKEQINEAKKLLKQMIKRYPDNIESYLILSKTHLKCTEYEQAQNLLKEVKKINENDESYILEEIQQEYIIHKHFDDKNMPKFTNTKIKAAYDQFFAIHELSCNNNTSALKHIEKAIQKTPNTAVLYIIKLEISWKITRETFIENIQSDLEIIKDYKQEIDDIKLKFKNFMTSSPRLLLQLECFELIANLAINDTSQIEINMKKSLILLETCYFDDSIDLLLIMFIGVLNQKHLDSILKYLSNANRQMSDVLARKLFLVLLSQGKQITQIKEFFDVKQNLFINNIIHYIKSNEHELMIEKIKADEEFAYIMALANDIPPELKLTIINANIITTEPKKWLLFKYYSLINNQEKVLETIQDINIDYLDYHRCHDILQVFRNHEVWEKLIPILYRLLKFKLSESEIIGIQLELCKAYFMLKDYSQCLKIGNSILQKDRKEFEEYFEGLLYCMLTSYLNKNMISEAINLFEKYDEETIHSQTLMVFMIDVYIKNSQPETALQFMLNAIVTIGNPSPKEYADFALQDIDISNQLNTKSPESLPKVIEDCFIQIDENPNWFYIGNKDYLDANLITAGSKLDKYNKLINKKVGDIVILNEFRNNHKQNKITRIYNLKDYIIWQIRHHANNLALENQLEHIIPIDLQPNKDGSLDLDNLIKFMKNHTTNYDQIKELYSKNEMPLAFLTIFTKDILHAITIVSQDKKGFIIAISNDYKEQEKVANNIIDNNTEIYNGSICQYQFL